MRRPVTLMRWACILILGPWLAGCFSFSRDAEGPPFAEAALNQRPGMATLVLYRPDVYAGSALWPLIAFDGRPVLRLYNRGYSVIHVAPGTHRISARVEKPGRFVQRIVKEEQELELRADAGKTYFVEYRVDESVKNKSVTLPDGTKIPYSDQPASGIRLVLSERLPGALRYCRYVEPLAAVPAH